MRLVSLLNGQENTLQLAFFGNSKQLQWHDSITFVVDLYQLQLFWLTMKVKEHCFLNSSCSTLVDSNT